LQLSTNEKKQLMNENEKKKSLLQSESRRINWFTNLLVSMFSTLSMLHGT